jgi:hypothetical protein
MLLSSAAAREGITLIRVMDADIRPEPDEAEREAILAALAADAAAARPASEWAEALLPGRDGKDGAPYPE